MAGGAILQIKEVHNIGSIHDYPIQKIVCILAVSIQWILPWNMYDKGCYVSRCRGSSYGSGMAVSTLSVIYNDVLFMCHYFLNRIDTLRRTVIIVSMSLLLTLIGTFAESYINPDIMKMFLNKVCNIV